jgi:hypothetical protein
VKLPYVNVEKGSFYAGNKNIHLVTLSLVGRRPFS